MQPVPCVVLAACAAVASAQVTLVNENRVFDLSAQGESDFGGGQESVLDIGSSSNDDPFVPWAVGGSVFTNEAQSAIASASGQYLMNIDAAGFYSSGSLHAAASILDETGYNASAHGSALMEVTFSLAVASRWRLTLEGSGPLMAELTRSGGSSVFFHPMDLEGFELDYALDPGEYTLVFAASVSANTFTVGSVEDSTFMQASFVLVPAPGAAVLLGASLAFAARRRR